jgi:hypothetical protein
MNQKSNMHVDGESDGRTVPTKCSNKSGKPLAEGMEPYAAILPVRICAGVVSGRREIVVLYER